MTAYVSAVLHSRQGNEGVRPASRGRFTKCIACVFTPGRIDTNLSIGFWRTPIGGVFLPALAGRQAGQSVATMGRNGTSLAWSADGPSSRRREQPPLLGVGLVLGDEIGAACRRREGSGPV